MKFLIISFALVAAASACILCRESEPIPVDLTGPRSEVASVMHQVGPQGYVPQVGNLLRSRPDASSPSIPSKLAWGHQGNYFGPWLRDASAPSDTVEST